MIIENLQGKFNNFAKNRKEQKRFVKFAIVGLIGAAVDFAVFNLLIRTFVRLLVIDPRSAALLANPLSVGCAILSNFTWNRLWSFPESRKRPLLPQLGQFTLINLVGLIINTAIVALMLYLVLPPFSLSEAISANLAKATAIGIVLFWNFGVNRLWTYRGL